MINKKLLNHELECYKDRNIELKPMKFSKDIINHLFNKFKDYGILESSYCYRGEDDCCWLELIEEGVWELSLSEVKENIQENVRYIRKYLYNRKKYGNRLYMYEDKDKCYVYIYLRDKIKCDYSMWFSNE